MKYLSFFLLFSNSIISLAQTESPALVTDRPDQTESSSVVPFHTLQIETGFIMETKETNDILNRSFSYNTTLLRYGLLENFEMRLGLAYNQLRFISKTSGEVAHNLPELSPLYTGFKLMVTDEEGWIPEVAFLGGLILPFTSPQISRPSNIGATMRFSLSHTLSDKVSLGYNLGAEWDGESASPSYFYSVALGMSLTNKVGVFVESYGLLTVFREHLVDAGITYAVLPILQLDISAGLGLNEWAIDHFISCGLSLRIPE